MLQESRICSDCDKEFAAVMHKGVWTRRCPTCADIAQRRPSVCRSRTTIYGPTTCVIESLPGEWEKFTTGQHRDEYVWKISVKGREFGAQWNGRVDIYARQPFVIGKVVDLVEIEAVHSVLATRTEQATSGFTQAKGGPAVVTHREVVAPREHLHQQVEDASAELETHRYIRLQQPAPAVAHGREAMAKDDLPRLVWRVAHSKTTIKGFGRQYGAHLDGDPLCRGHGAGGRRASLGDRAGLRLPGRQAGI